MAEVSSCNLPVDRKSCQYYISGLLQSSYCNNTFKDNDTFIRPHSSLLLSLGVLLISLRTKGVEQPQKRLVQSVPLLIILWLRIAGAAQKVRGNVITQGENKL